MSDWTKFSCFTVLLVYRCSHNLDFPPGKNQIIAEEERGGTLQSVPVNGDKNQASTQDICAELRAELREKELARENLVKQKSDLFDQSKMSIDEAEKLLQEMVAVKLQSDVAADNMNQLAAKWERIREKFMFQEQ
ncbi:hypothetical protein Tco_0759035 [Tanacetum coccineum]